MMALPLALAAWHAPARGQEPSYWERQRLASLRSGALLAAQPWGVSAYVGFLEKAYFSRIYFSPGKIAFSDHHVFGLLGHRHLFTFFDHLHIELEVGGSIDDSGRFSEVHLAPVFRWNLFPWNEFVYTTFGFSPLGASYTFHTAAAEKKYGAKGQDVEFLNHLALEFTFALPEAPHIALFLRHQHRSAVFTRVNGSLISIEYGVVGLRLRF